VPQESHATADRQDGSGAEGRILGERPDGSWGFHGGRGRRNPGQREGQQEGEAGSGTSSNALPPIQSISKPFVYGVARCGCGSASAPASSEAVSDRESTNALESLVERLSAALDGREEVLEAYLFGSAARGDDQPHSDVDVAVTVRHGAPRDAGYGYAAELASVLMSALGRDRVDVVVLNDASPLLYHRVLRDGIRILSRDLKATTVREGQALSRYCDYVPQLRKIEAARAFASRAAR